MEARANPGESNRRLHEAALACLRNAGFSVAEAIHAYSVQDAYVYGYALQERTLGLDTRDEWRGVANANSVSAAPGPTPIRPPPRCSTTSPSMASATMRSSCSDSTSSSTDSSSGLSRGSAEAKAAE